MDGGANMEERGLQFELSAIDEAYLDAWEEWHDANADMYNVSPCEGECNV